MIELRDERLHFRYPEVHPEARLTVGFQRTLRIPDDGKDYPLPPGLGWFPMEHVDDHAERVPEAWVRRGGVMLPMYQAEALWISFRGTYPFAVKVAAGKVNAVTGEDWSEGLNRDPQDYMVVPDQPWLDGFCVEEGVVRQFVAMPLGAGYTAEEQLRGTAEHGGLQIVARPMKAEAYERWKERWTQTRVEEAPAHAVALSAAPDMGLAPGGRMRQEIYEDDFDFADWDTRHGSRCFVHLCNSLVWKALTGESAPLTPVTSSTYERYGLPWFEYYSDRKALEGSDKARELRSIMELAREKGDVPLPENESVEVERVVRLGDPGTRDRVREGEF